MSKLSEYAHLTAADMESDYESAIRAMREEPLIVATEIGCSEEEVIVWCSAALAPTVEPVTMGGWYPLTSGYRGGFSWRNGQLHRVGTREE